MADVLTAAHTPDQTNWAGDVHTSCLKEMCNVALGSDFDLITENNDMDLFNKLFSCTTIFSHLHTTRKCKTLVITSSVHVSESFISFLPFVEKEQCRWHSRRWENPSNDFMGISHWKGWQIEPKVCVTAWHRYFKQPFLTQPLPSWPSLNGLSYSKEGCHCVVSFFSIQVNTIHFLFFIPSPQRGNWEASWFILF